MNRQDIKDLVSESQGCNSVTLKLIEFNTVEDIKVS